MSTTSPLLYQAGVSRKFQSPSVWTFSAWKSEISRTSSLRTAGILLLGLVRLFLKHVESLSALVAEPKDPKKPRKPRMPRISESLPAVMQGELEDPEILVEPPELLWSPFSPRHSEVPEEAVEFPATEISEISDSVERLQKRPRLSVLSDVLDDLRGEEIFERRESERFSSARLSEITGRPSLAASDAPLAEPRRKNKTTTSTRRVDLPRKFRNRKLPVLDFSVKLDFSCLFPVPIVVSTKDATGVAAAKSAGLGDSGFAEQGESEFAQDFDEGFYEDPIGQEVGENAGDLANQGISLVSGKRRSGNFQDFVSATATRREAARAFADLVTMAHRGEAEILGNFNSPLTIKIFSAIRV